MKRLVDSEFFQGARSFWGRSLSARSRTVRGSRARLAKNAIAAIVLFFGVQNSVAAEAISTKGTDTLVHVKGLALRFPSSGPDADDIMFSDSGLTKKISLRALKQDQKAAEQLFDRYDAIIISVPNVWARPGLFLDRFPRDQFRGFRSDFLVGGNAQRICADRRQKFLSFLSKKDQAPLIEEGWSTFPYSASPGTFSVRAGNEANARLILGLDCNGFCHSMVCLGENALFSFQFDSAAYPMKSWAELLTHVDQMLRYLIPAQ